MPTDFRSASGKQLEWADASEQSGFSNFLYVDKNYDSEGVLRRIFSLARKLKYRSLIVEEISHAQCDLYAEEDTVLKLRRPDFVKSVVHRLSFLGCAPNTKPASVDFLAYAIVKQDYFASEARPSLHVYESVMVPPRSVSQNNFIHCGRPYAVNTSAGPLTLSGVLYAQQNGNTYVCAHVALRTALATVLDEGDITYSKINTLAGVDHVNRQVGQDKGGLDSDDMENILKQLGVDYEKIVHDPKQKIDLPTEYQKNIYGFIESGQPVLLGFELADASGTGDAGRHIIPVFGHTFNEDTWVPDAQQLYFGESLRYFSSESWLSAYVIHDDNVGPYYCLPRHYLRKDNFRLILGLRCTKAMFSALDVDAIASEYLRAIGKSNPKLGIPWYDRFALFAALGFLVLRTILITRDQYVDHLKKIKDREGNALEPQIVSAFEKGLPAQFWLTEASAQELFSSTRRKFGEILIAFDKPAPKPLDPSLIVGIRLPGQAAVGDSMDFVETNLQGHTQLFTFFPSDR